jgi:hypothetical protein
MLTRIATVPVTSDWRLVAAPECCQEVVGVQIGDLSWKTDASLKSSPDEIIIVFNGPLGYAREIARREDVAAAVTEFSNRFGLR